MPKYATNIIGNSGNTGGKGGQLEIECSLQREQANFYVDTTSRYICFCICIWEILGLERAINDFVGAQPKKNTQRAWCRNIQWASNDWHMSVRTTVITVQIKCLAQTDEGETERSYRLSDKWRFFPFPEHKPCLQIINHLRGLHLVFDFSKFQNFHKIKRNERNFIKEFKIFNFYWQYNIIL